MKTFTVLLLIIISGLRSYAQIDTTEFKRYQFLYHKYKVTNADSAKLYIVKMDSLTKIQEASLWRHKYYDILGGWYSQIRNNKASLDAHKKSLEVTRQIGDKGSEVLARFNVAGGIGDSGDLKEAIAEFKEVETLLGNSVRDHRIRIALYGNLTLYSLNLEDIPQAKHYNQLMHKHLKTYSDSVRYYITKVEILSKEEKHQEELNTGLQALKTVKTEDLRNLGLFNSYVGKAYLKTGDLKKASIYLDRSRKVSDKSGITDISLDLGFGEIAYLSEDYSEALKYFSKVQNHAERTKDARLLTTVLPKIKETYYKLGLYKEAFERQKEDEMLQDSLTGIETKKYVTEVEAKYELKEKQRTIEQQKKESGLQQELLKVEERRKNTFAILLIVSMFFLGLAVYLLRRIQKDRIRIINQRNEIEGYSQTLEETNKMKDKLFAVISHDLRSPISSLANTLTLYNEEKQSKPLQDTLISLSNIQLILSNLLNWANLQIRDNEPVFSDVNVSSLLESVVSQVETQAKAKSIDILSSYTDAGEVYTDEHYLQIVLRNILTNAIKFTPEEGVVKIVSCREQKGVSIKIRDTGIGIPAEKLSEIFNYPKSQEGTVGEKGTGLGLSFSKDLVDRVLGKITIKSKPDVGTEVTLLLPVQAGQKM